MGVAPQGPRDLNFYMLLMLEVCIVFELQFLGCIRVHLGLFEVAITCLYLLPSFYPNKIMCISRLSWCDFCKATRHGPSALVVRRNRTIHHETHETDTTQPRRKMHPFWVLFIQTGWNHQLGLILRWNCNTSHQIVTCFSFSDVLWP